MVVNYAKSAEAAGKAVDEVNAAGGDRVAVRADREAFGPTGILANNTGIYSFLPLERSAKPSFRDQFDLNVPGLIYAAETAFARARVNAIAPGARVDDMNPDDAFKACVLARSAVNRLGAPDDIAKAALYLASDDSPWVRGESSIAGGAAFECTTPQRLARCSGARRFDAQAFTRRTGRRDSGDPLRYQL